MELTVTTKRDNALLDRTEVYFEISHPAAGTPGRGDIKKALAGALNAKDGVLVLDWARSEFGRCFTRGYAKVYASKERALALEAPPILIRNGLLAAVKKEAPKEAREPPAPKREPKQPAKAEPPEKEAAPKAEKKEATKAPAKEEKKEEAPKAEKKEPAKKEAKAEGPKEKKPAPKKEGK